MARRGPDRMAAVVDLMSHLFMLSVMLFILAIPFRDKSDKDKQHQIHFQIKVESNGRALDVNYPELRAIKDDLQGQIVFVANKTISPISAVLRQTRFFRADNSFAFDATYRGGLPPAAAILFNGAKDDILFQSLDLLITVRTDKGWCSERSDMGIVVGSNPYYLFNLDSCRAVPG